MAVKQFFLPFPFNSSIEGRNLFHSLFEGDIRQTVCPASKSMTSERSGAKSTNVLARLKKRKHKPVNCMISAVCKLESHGMRWSLSVNSDRFHLAVYYSSFPTEEFNETTDPPGRSPRPDPTLSM
jgi:hypothetical protein